MQNEQTFKELLEETKAAYQKIGKVYCPALGADVVFNSDGFNHLRNKSSRVNRSKAEQRNKLAHVLHAAVAIGTTTTVQEYREELQTLDTDGGRSHGLVKVSYFGFWMVLDFASALRVKFVVRFAAASGQYCFWSVMPFWKERTINGQRVREVASRGIADE
jgi:hypothetical protein